MEWELGMGWFHSENVLLYLAHIINCRVSLQASPLYIAEIAPREKRGIMTAFVNGFSTTGAVVRAVLAHTMVIHYKLQGSEKELKLL